VACLAPVSALGLPFIGLNRTRRRAVPVWAFQERGGAGAAAHGPDRVPDEVGGRGPGRRLQVEEVRQEVRQEQPQPKVANCVRPNLQHHTTGLLAHSLHDNCSVRNYYRCSTEGCNVKKRVERDRDDPGYVVTTYEGTHNHASPSTVYYASQDAASGRFFVAGTQPPGPGPGSLVN
jgi:hypothetical protein